MIMTEPKTVPRIMIVIRIESDSKLSRTSTSWRRAVEESDTGLMICNGVAAHFAEDIHQTPEQEISKRNRSLPIILTYPVGVL